MSKLSQSTRIYRAIRDYPKFHFGKGIPNHKLARIALNYTMRISDLRKDGHNITAHRDIVNGRNTGTWRYYLNDIK